MKSIFLAFLSMIMLPLSSAGQNTFPSVEVKTVDGKSFNTSEIDNGGKPIILCIWEVSCAPCIQEFNSISEYLEGWQKETGVKVVAISIDDNRNYSRVKPLVKSKGWNFEFYQDKNQDIKRALGISYCPFTLILDGNKSVVWSKGTYSQGDEETIFQVVQKIVGGERVEQ